MEPDLAVETFLPSEVGGGIRATAQIYIAQKGYPFITWHNPLNLAMNKRRGGLSSNLTGPKRFKKFKSYADKIDVVI